MRSNLRARGDVLEREPSARVLCLDVFVVDELFNGRKVPALETNRNARDSNKQLDARVLRFMTQNFTIDGDGSSEPSADSSEDWEDTYRDILIYATGESQDI